MKANNSMEFEDIYDPEYLAGLLQPEFEIVKGLVLLTAHFDERNISQWFIGSSHLADPPQMENTINHVHLDYFTDHQEKQKLIGEQIKAAWIKALKDSFPDMTFSVYLAPTENGWELCMHSIRDK